MKYWVYKESRILGPFDKEAVSGLPGLDAGTLVCTGDPAGSSWVPAGELDGLRGIVASGAGGLLDDLPSSIGLLDQLQIDSAGLVGDDEFPGSFAEELFQDASFKKSFSDVLSTGSLSGDTEARRAREKIIELTAQLEVMHRHVSELELGQTDLKHRLAAKNLEGQSQAPVVPSPEVKTFLSAAPPPIPGGAPPVAAVPEAPPPSAEWPVVPPDGAAGFPSFAGDAQFPSKPEPVAATPATKPTLPDIPSFAFAAALAPTPVELPADPASIQAPPPVSPAPKTFSFGAPKSFKVVPTIKSFKVIGSDDAAPAAAANPVPEFKIDPIVETPVPEAPSPVPAPAPITLAPVELAPAPLPIPAPMPEPASIPNPFTLPERVEVASPAAMVPPPNTLSQAPPVPDLTSSDMVGSSDATAVVPPPVTMARSAGAAEPVDAAAARFAKPEPAPPTGEIVKPARNNKPFLIAGGVLVTALIVVGVIFMRQPKDDLKQMATLDDGKAPLGLPADDVAVAPPPMVKPKIAEPDPVPAPPPGPSPEHVAAIAAVKDFPLDGERGTVGRWLQYSYTADTNAGTEEWSASTTAENTFLIEYRLVPSASGGKGALYLFELDANGIVMGKNIEARQMLAGSPPAEAPKAKKPVKKSAPKRRAVIETPKEVPLLPLPDSGELRPPAEDDGSFGSDTINSGI